MTRLAALLRALADRLAPQPQTVVRLDMREVVRFVRAYNRRNGGTGW